MKPVGCFAAPGSAAAFSRNAAPAFFSVPAADDMRPFANSSILGPYVWRSAFAGLFSTPSVRPSFTTASSASFSANGPRFRLMARPRT